MGAAVGPLAGLASPLADSESTLRVLREPRLAGTPYEVFGRTLKEPRRLSAEGGWRYAECDRGRVPFEFLCSPSYRRSPLVCVTGRDGALRNVEACVRAGQDGRNGRETQVRDVLTRMGVGNVEEKLRGCGFRYALFEARTEAMGVGSTAAEAAEGGNGPGAGRPLAVRATWSNLSTALAGLHEEHDLVDLVMDGVVEEAVRTMGALGVSEAGEEGSAAAAAAAAFRTEVEAVRGEVVERLRPFADPWEGPQAVQRWYVEAHRREVHASAEAKAVRFRVWADLGLGLNSQFLGNGMLPDGTSEWWVPNIALVAQAGPAPFVVIDLAS